MRVSRLLLTLTLVTLCAYLTGCAKPQPGTTANGTTEAGHDDHEHDEHEHDEHEHDEHEHEEDHPATYGEAVTRIGELRDKIRDSFAANDHDAAHGPLHDVFHTIEHLPELAQGESFHVDVQADVKKHSEHLLDLFTQVDAKFHDAEGKSYDEVSADIDAVIEKLRHPEGQPAEAETPTP